MKKINIILSVAFLASSVLTSCDSDGKDAIHYNNVTITDIYPDDASSVTPVSGIIKFTELNTSTTSSFPLPAAEGIVLPDGVYDAEATLDVSYTPSAGDAATVTGTIRATISAHPLTADSEISLKWFFYNPAGSLVFSEIYCTGSLNATGTNGLRDTYFKIYNNTDSIIYADGLALAESAFVNAKASTFEILTSENDRNVNFTAGTVWVIPGSGKDVPVEPGKSITIVDQAIDWNAQVPGALNLTTADFEWWDDHAQDTDNPSVPNLDKWYSYSATIWIVSNQANRSYALVRFPEGMTAESYLSNYHGGYDYIGSTGKQMHNDKAYLIPNSWIVDGVNLSNKETWVHGALGEAIDLSYASAGDINRDPNRFGHKFSRRVAAETSTGRIILTDTDNSAVDFEFVPVK